MRVHLSSLGEGIERSGGSPCLEDVCARHPLRGKPQPSETLAGCQGAVPDALCHIWVGTGLLFYGWHPPSCPRTGTACVGVLQHPHAQRALPGTLLRAGVASGDAEPTAQGTASIWGMQQWDTMQGHHPPCAPQLQQPVWNGKLEQDWQRPETAQQTRTWETGALCG